MPKNLVERVGSSLLRSSWISPILPITARLYLAGKIYGKKMIFYPLKVLGLITSTPRHVLPEVMNKVISVKPYVEPLHSDVPFLPYPVYTFRWILIDSVEMVEDYKKRYDIKDLTSKQLKEAFDKLSRIVHTYEPPYERLAAFETAILEELIHHQIANNTTLSMMVHTNSLALRFDLIYLTDRMLDLLEIERSQLKYQRNTKINSSNLEHVFKDEHLVDVWSNAITHYLWLHLYRSATLPIIEGTTLTITNPNPENKAKIRYGTRDEDTVGMKRRFEAIKEIIQDSENLLKEQSRAGVPRNSAVDILITCANSALNLPLQELTNVRMEITHNKVKSDLNRKLRDLLFQRFHEAVLHSEPPVASDFDSGMQRAIVCLTNEVDDKILAFGLHLIYKKRGFFMNISSGLSRDTYRYPGIMALERSKGMRFVYDTEVERITGKTKTHPFGFRGLEDLLDGNPRLVQFHKFLLDLLWHLDELEELYQKKGWFLEMVNLINELSKTPPDAEKVGRWLLDLAYDCKTLLNREGYLRPIVFFATAANNDVRVRRKGFVEYMSIYIDALDKAKELGIFTVVESLSNFTYPHGSL